MNELFSGSLMTIISLLLLGWALVFFMMTLVYGLARVIKNAGIVDVFWAFGFSLLITLYLLYGGGHWIQKLLTASMGYLASIRLTWHILKRFLKEHPVEDPRYTAFKVYFHEHPEWMTFWVFQLQGVLMTAVSLPFLLACSKTSAALSVIEYLAIAIFFTAFLGEALADYQLTAFKNNPDNRGKTCQTGLWRYSRHPNYFFQWLIWVAFALFALPAPWGWTGIIAPICMLHFLVNVTGIKATEAHAVQSRKDYAEYQKTTSPFIPWFPSRLQSQSSNQ